jgi:alkanesulfonate monooxygenase SsuD/methylene tetrahydromethanopterin reductase-like flavin-dependent oxidoreductase (luciferase family)
MKFAVSVPNFGTYFHPRIMAELARDAEGAGWDGFFIWDHIWLGSERPFVDPWVALASIAMSTDRIRIGTMVTPVARRRPWKLARETVSIDHLSDGRLVLGIGLGAPPESEYGSFGEEMNEKIRAEKLDEGIDILTGLWSGKPFSFRGKHFEINSVTFNPPPVQKPRIPIWVAGVWPRKRPFLRASRWDGVFPIISDGFATDKELHPDDFKDILNLVKLHRKSDQPIDVIKGGVLPSTDQIHTSEILTAYKDAGVTWWVHGFEDEENLESVKSKMRAGPPRL